jgi:DNA end-binding protein Ku
MAEQLIESMSGPWKPADFRDTYTDRVNDLIKAKSKGKKVKTADPAPDPTAASDLFEVLRRSVEAASKRRSGSASTPAKKTASKKAASKKASAKKAAAAKTPAKKAAAAKTPA